MIIFLFLPLISIAMVAELVDAPVSKTGEVTLVPVRSRPVVQQKRLLRKGRLFFICNRTICRLKPASNLVPSFDYFALFT